MLKSLLGKKRYCWLPRLRERCSWLLVSRGQSCILPCTSQSSTTKMPVVLRLRTLASTVTDIHLPVNVDVCSYFVLTSKKNREGQVNYNSFTFSEQLKKSKKLMSGNKLSYPINSHKFSIMWIKPLKECDFMIT